MDRLDALVQHPFDYLSMKLLIKEYRERAKKHRQLRGPIAIH